MSANHCFIQYCPMDSSRRSRKSIYICYTCLSLLVAIWQGIGVGVVKQTVVPVAPGKRFGSDSQVGVRNERILSVLLNVVMMGFLFLHGAVGTQKAPRNGDEQRYGSPRTPCFQSVLFFFGILLRYIAGITPPSALEASQTQSQNSRHLCPLQRSKVVIKFHSVSVY